LHFKLFCSAPNTSRCRLGFQTTRLTSILNCFLKHKGSSAGLAQGQLPVAEPRGHQGPRHGCSPCRAGCCQHRGQSRTPVLQPGPPAPGGEQQTQVPRHRGSPRAAPQPSKPGTPAVTNPRFASRSSPEQCWRSAQLALLLAAPGRAVFPGSDAPRTAGNQPQALGRRTAREARQHPRSSGSARLRPAALFTAAPKPSVSPRQQNSLIEHFQNDHRFSFSQKYWPNGAGHPATLLPGANKPSPSFRAPGLPPAGSLQQPQSGAAAQSRARRSRGHWQSCRTSLS